MFRGGAGTFKGKGKGHRHWKPPTAEPAALVAVPQFVADGSSWGQQLSGWTGREFDLPKVDIRVAFAHVRGSRMGVGSTGIFRMILYLWVQVSFENGNQR